MTFSYGGTIVLATVGNSGSCTHVASSFCAFINPADGHAFFVEQSPASGRGWVASRITNTAIPEAATWAMLVAGFGLVGAAARRRKAVVAA